MDLDHRPSEHARENRRHWNANAPYWVAAGERAWAADEPYWGVWELPESELGMLPGSMAGMRAVELGCGTGYGSAWMARRGASVTAVDISEGQLATARRLAAEHGLSIAFRHASAEQVPAPDASFDFALSEYGAAIWCDPHVWIPEAARLLRPGGHLVFLGTHPLLSCCYATDGGSADERLKRSWFDLHRLDWTEAEVDPGGIEFNLPFAGWLAVFRAAGLVVEDHLELRAPIDADGERFAVTVDWARRWPSEQVWKLRKS